MGVVSREQFLAMQQKKAEGVKTNFAQGPRVGYFKLDNDGDEAVVRFIYSTDEQVYNDILIVHKSTVDGKFRRVNCLRNFNEPISKCPLCANGEQNQQRFYIKMVEYTRDEEGNVTGTPKVWERPTSYVNTLLDKFSEYGDLSECIFKVRRHGVKGDMKTTYSIDLANPNIYNSSIYKKDFSAFDNYNVVGTAVLDKSFDELAEMAGSAPAAEQPQQKFSEQASAPRRVTY